MPKVKPAAKTPAPVHLSHFARELVRLRELRGLTQAALASRMGVARQTLSRLELGQREPQWEHVQLAALALGVALDAFRDPAVELPAEVERRKRGRPAKSEV